MNVLKPEYCEIFGY